jgi:hypothetical protein
VVLEITTPTRPPPCRSSTGCGSTASCRARPACGGRGRRADGTRARRADSTIADAYTYLPNSVKRFPGPAALAGEMERAGLGDIGYLLRPEGIVAIHTGTVLGEGV